MGRLVGRLMVNLAKLYLRYCFHFVFYENIIDFFTIQTILLACMIVC